MQKVAFILAGFKQNITDKKYQNIGGFFKAKGINPVFVQTKWEYKTMTQYVSEFLKITAKYQNAQFYYVGFSFGAMIAFIAASKVPPVRLILCSLSPYFKEDLKSTPAASKKYLGKKRIDDFANYSFDQLAKNIHSSTFLLLGKNEAKKFETLHTRVKLAHEKMKKNTLCMIEKGEHDIGQAKYQLALKKIIDNL